MESAKTTKIVTDTADLFVAFIKKDKMCYLKRTVPIRAPHTIQVGQCGLNISSCVTYKYDFVLCYIC